MIIFYVIFSIRSFKDNNFDFFLELYYFKQLKMSALDELYLKIQLISNVGVGEKINVKSYSIASSWFGSIERFLKGENRELLLKFMEDIIDDINYITRSLGKIDLFLFKNKLKDCFKGINNLLNTYTNDDFMRSKIKWFAQELTKCIQNIETRESLLLNKSDNLYIINKEKTFLKTIEETSKSYDDRSEQAQEFKQIKKNINSTF